MFHQVNFCLVKKFAIFHKYLGKDSLVANPLFHLIFPEFQPSSILELLPPSLGLEISIEVTVTMPYSPANKEVMMTYEDLVNKR